MIEPIHTTGLVTLVGKDDQIGQNEYGAAVKLDIATAAGLPSRAAATGTVQKPAGTIFLFTAEPDVAPADASLADGASWAGAWAAVTLATTDWIGDDVGAMAEILTEPIPFHAVPALWAAYLHQDATAFNAEDNDDETVHMRAWFRRES